MEAHQIQEWIDKTGGRYPLTVMLQRRLVSLSKGAAPLVEIDTPGLKDAAFEELRHGKIALELPEKPAPKPKSAMT